MNREEQRQEFLRELNLGHATLLPLAPDASSRCYFRLAGADQPLMLMDAPPETENVGQFVEVTEQLTQLGARVPTLYASDVEHGFLLLEDLGDQTFTRLLATGSDETALYQSATDALTDIQRAFIKAPQPFPVPIYDLELCMQEATLFTDWYLPAVLGRLLEPDERQGFVNAITALFDSLPVSEMVLVHRDFHVDNLLMINRQCAMLDYQDAVMGSAAYDLVSLLEDARRDVDPGIKTRMRLRWQNRHGLTHTDTEIPFRFWGAQRHCKVAGIFVRLWLRDGKPVYLEHLDRVLGLLAESVNHVDMEILSDWIGSLLSPIKHRDFAGEEHQLRKVLGIQG